MFELAPLPGGGGAFLVDQRRINPLPLHFPQIR
jgi:hypothetical protein